MSSIFKKLLKKSSKSGKQGRGRTGERDVNDNGGTPPEDSDGESKRSWLSERLRRSERLRHWGGTDGAMDKTGLGDGASAAGGTVAEGTVAEGTVARGTVDYYAKDALHGLEGYSVVEKVLMEDDDLKCSCCYELMVEPTTLNCGHSFCRHCLALWLNSGKQRICPQCRGVWMGFPQINYSLRNIMKSTLPHEYKRRENEVQNNSAFQAARTQFNKECSQNQQLQQSAQVPEQNRGRHGVVLLIERAMGVNWQNVMAFKNGVFLTVGVICAFYILSFMFHWLFGHEEDLVSRWSVDRVQGWLKEQGEWTEKDVSPKFLENQISGSLLLALNEEDFKNMLTLDDLHFRALIMSVKALKVQGKDIPSSVFQYKARFMGRAVFLLFGLRNYPRLTILWMCLFDHEELFLPFTHVTSPVLENMADLSLFSYHFPPMILSQWTDFGINWIFFPYWLIAKFSWRCASVSWSQMLLTIVCCIAKTGMEGAGVRLIFRNPRKLATAVTNHLKQISAYPLMAIIWNFIPSSLINICFFFAIYIMPFIDVYNLYNLLRLTIGR